MSRFSEEDRENKELRFKEEPVNFHKLHGWPNVSNAQNVSRLPWDNPKYKDYIKAK